MEGDVLDGNVANALVAVKDAAAGAMRSSSSDDKRAPDLAMVLMIFSEVVMFDRGS